VCSRPTAWSRNTLQRVVETVLPDGEAWAAGKSQHFGNHLDINMLVLSGGRERTGTEFASLLANSGWKLERVIRTASAYSIVEGVAASQAYRDRP
jgi:hypothetical protein